MNRKMTGVAGCLLIFVSTTAEPLLAQQTTPPPQGSAPAQQTPASPSTMQPPIELPDNPGSTVQNPPAQNQPANPPGQTQKPQQPSGTAVAPEVRPSGGAASKPAGVAIAPPKQRQIRSLLIKFGFLAGAGVAIGTVVGLSAASPSHVPNSPGH
jgi:hypothetical protein